MTEKKVPCRAWLLETAFHSHPGGRSVNEDMVSVKEENGTVLISVADGLGAHGGGDIAARTAVETAEREFFSRSFLTARGIRKALGRLNAAVTAKQTDQVQMKTTYSALLLRKRGLTVLHVGDTRVYQFANDRILNLTKDHTYAYDEVMAAGGDLNELRNHPNRHFLREALGAPVIHPAVSWWEIEAGQSFLLCSDGFWEYVNEEEMLRGLRETETAGAWLEEMLRFHHAKAGQWHDNYSAVCVRIRERQ